MGITLCQVYKVNIIIVRNMIIIKTYLNSVGFEYWFIYICPNSFPNYNIIYILFQ
jgi:hypothetical protein